MNSLAWLTEVVLRDCGTKCGADPSMDINTVHRRTEYEGESFLTITLPAYCSALEKALSVGRLEPTMVPMFHWHRRGLPEFLRGFLLLIFRQDGSLLPNPSAEAIACVRQVLLTHKKVLREASSRRSRAAVERYKECEREVQAHQTSEPYKRLFRSVSRVVVCDLLSGVPFGDPRPLLHPHHGPGATAERIRGNSKFLFRRWHRRLEEVFPYTEFGLASVRNVEVDLNLGVDVDFTEPGDEQPVRVVFVPKTQKTPRVIAIEPVCMQYMQQALMRWLVPLVEKGSYTRGRVNFVDQSINASLALSSSRSGRYATIDLSEASDRVSLDLVKDLFACAPVLLECVLACRSTRAILPDGDVLTLSKFASMGSALTFPVEALAFFIAIVSMRLEKLRLPPTSANIKRCCSHLYIYGDDIIVPVDEAPAVCAGLEAYGLKVNTHKSFWTGKFRESCGMDAYDGSDVTPTYVRHEQPTDRRQAERLISWVSMANQFYLKGFWATARAIRSRIEMILGPLPCMGPDCRGLHWVSYSKEHQYSRWNKELMRFEEKLWVPRTIRTPDHLDGDAALLKCFGLIGQAVSADPEHLKTVVARGKLALTRRWVPSL